MMSILKHNLFSFKYLVYGHIVIHMLTLFNHYRPFAPFGIPNDMARAQALESPTGTTGHRSLAHVVSLVQYSTRSQSSSLVDKTVRQEEEEVR